MPLKLSVRRNHNAAMRLLVIDDEPKTAAYLKKHLEKHGFIVDTAATGLDGLHLAMTEEYDVLIVDILLPQLNGRKVIECLRTRKTTPVLFLGARDRLDDRVRGQTLSGDDYLVRPFAFEDLLAKVQDVLRSRLMREPRYIFISDLEIDVIKRRVCRAGTRIDLTPRAYSLLLLLARNQGEVLSRSQIASSVWEMTGDSGTNVVDVAVKRLRVKLDEPYKIKLIQTVRGMGYVLDVRK
jgi:two-component system copper resistance phosphate regulon response regulator CusR